MGNPAKDAQILIEGGQDYHPFVALTDQGDHQNFVSADELWSDANGKAADLRPNGIINGGIVTPAASGAQDAVDVTAALCYLNGQQRTVAAATDLAVTRPSTGTNNITSITIDNTGTFAAVAGTDGDSFAESRGASGSAPYIPVDSIEVSQVRLDSQASAVIAASEILSQAGVARELYNYPIPSPILGQVANGVLGQAGVKLGSPLPLIHTGDTAKKIFASYYTPSFSEIPESSEMKLPEITQSVSSTAIYGGAVGSVSESLSQGSFNAELQDGITDLVVQSKNQKLWFKFLPNRYKAPYSLCQGFLGIARTFPAGGNMTAACTISAASGALEVVG